MVFAGDWYAFETILLEFGYNEAGAVTMHYLHMARIDKI